MIRRLQIKFVAINMTMVTIMLCAIFGLVYHFTQKNLENESISMMKDIVVNPFQLGRPNEASSQLKLPFFTLQLGMEGELVAAGGGYYDLSDSTFLKDLIEKSMHSRQEIGVMEEYNLRYFRVKMPMGTMLVFSDMSSENNTLQSLLRSFAVIGLISFFVFLGISIFLARWAVGPVARAWQQQKQFIADASHELKTPLTVIMTNTELLQSMDYSQVQQTQFIQSIAVMSAQMKQLVEKMLLLAKSENEKLRPVMKALDLSRLAMDCAISLEGVFVERELVLESFIEPDMVVLGNADALRQVIDILLDNAQKYALEHSEAKIVLCSKDRHKCCLIVSSAGEEIPQQELKNIFRRFYRMDKARSRNGSFGLGLSIAENIVMEHKGKIWAESHDGINSFFVELRKVHSLV